MGEPGESRPHGVGRTRPEPVSAWLRWTYLILVAALAPVFALEYGVTNFLWFSNVALFGTLAGTWLRSRLLASMMALAAILPEIGWNLAFFGRLLFGFEFFGLVDYMFEPRIPLWARLMSLYHVPLPFLLIWLVWRWGYEPRALLWQTVLAWAILLVSFLLTSPIENINLVFGLVDDWGRPIWDPPFPLLALMTGLPFIVYLPTHILLRRWRGV